MNIYYLKKFRKEAREFVKIYVNKDDINMYDVRAGVEFEIRNLSLDKAKEVLAKQGRYLFELSDPESRHYVGENKKAIEPGEPADLVQVKWIPVYRKLGRYKFIELLKNNPDITLSQAKKKMKELC